MAGNAHPPPIIQCLPTRLPRNSHAGSNDRVGSDMDVMSDLNLIIQLLHRHQSGCHPKAPRSMVVFAPTSNVVSQNDTTQLSNLDSVLGSGAEPKPSAPMTQPACKIALAPIAPLGVTLGQSVSALMEVCASTATDLGSRPFSFDNHIHENRHILTYQDESWTMAENALLPVRRVW